MMEIIMKENINSYNNSRKRNLTILEELPYDALLHILSYLDPFELCNLGKVCKEFKGLSEDDWIWRGFYPIIKFNFCYHFQLNHFPKQLDSRHSKAVYIRESQLIRSVSKFIGVWSEKWCDVDVLNSTKISFNGSEFKVEYTKNKFEAEFISFNGKSLQFKLTGGDSGWSFLYTLSLINNSNGDSLSSSLNNNNNNTTITTSNGNTNTNLTNYHNNNKSFENSNYISQQLFYNQDDQLQQQDTLQLHVLRIHDNIEFNGIFCSSKSECNSPPHFRNKNNYKLYLLKQQQQQEILHLQNISSPSSSSSSSSSSTIIDNNQITNTNNDSRRYTRIYAY